MYWASYAVGPKDLMSNSPQKKQEPMPQQPNRSKQNKYHQSTTADREMGKPLGPTGEFFRRRDAWRKHPMLTNQFRHATPGLGIALVAFGIYVVGEMAYDKIYAPSHTTSASSHSH